MKTRFGTFARFLSVILSLAMLLSAFPAIGSEETEAPAEEILSQAAPEEAPPEVQPEPDPQPEPEPQPESEPEQPDPDPAPQPEPEKQEPDSRDEEPETAAPDQPEASEEKPEEESPAPPETPVQPETPPEQPSEPEAAPEGGEAGSPEGVVPAPAEPEDQPGNPAESSENEPGDVSGGDPAEEPADASADTPSDEITESADGAGDAPTDSPAEDPAGEPGETEEESEDSAEEAPELPYPAFLKADAILYENKELSRKENKLASKAVVFVIEAEGDASQVRYVFLDAVEEAEPVFREAWVITEELAPLTEEEISAWKQEDHEVCLRLDGFALEPVVFAAGETDTEPEESAGEEVSEEAEEDSLADGAEESGHGLGHIGKNPDDSADDRPDAEEEPAGTEETSEDLTGEEVPAVDGEETEHGLGHLQETEALGEETPEDSGLSTESPQESDYEALDQLGSGSFYIVQDGELGESSYIPNFSSLPDVRNQGSYGTCWAFSAVGAMEFDLITDNQADASVNLSEFYLAYFETHNYANPKGGSGSDNIQYETKAGETYLDIGGNSDIAYVILVSILGIPTESAVPYPTTDAQVEAGVSQDAAIYAQITGAYFINDNQMGFDDTANKAKIRRIKDLINAHGAVSASIYMINGSVDHPEDQNYPGVVYTVAYNDTKNALCGDFPYTNHDILLVGWDDNFAVDNFNSAYRPAKPGAWLVRNSWGGSGYGRSGYFWVSYYDAGLTNSSITAYDAEIDTEASPDFVYNNQRTPFPYSYKSVNGQEAVLVQTFTVQGGEKIHAVGLDVGDEKDDVTVKVTVGGQTASGSKTNALLGFHRITVSPVITLNAETKVTVTVTVKNKSGQEVSVPYAAAGSTKVSSSSGSITYTSGVDGGGFTVNGQRLNADSTIRLYTKTVPGSVAVTGLTLNKTSIPDAAEEETYQLTATVSPANATNRTVSWASSNSAVATVDQSGRVTIGSGTGTAIITAASASNSRITATCKITVPDRPLTGIAIQGFNGAKSFTVNDSNANGFKLGDNLLIDVAFTPEKTKQRDVIWTSSNPAVLQVTNIYEGGKVNLKSRTNGTATITVTSKVNSRISDSITITLDMSIVPTSVTLDRTSVTLYEKESTTLYAYVLPSNAKDRSVTWSSSNPAVAAVDGSGRVTAIKDGTSVITATTVSGQITASCTVTVRTRDPIEAFVYRMYRVCLLREPDAGGLAHWTGLLRSKERTGAEVVCGFYLSQEMVGRGYSSEQFVTRAYEGIMGRSPDAGGFAHWTSALDQGASYRMIVSGFTRSREFNLLCASYGITQGTVDITEARDRNEGITRFVFRLYQKALGRKSDIGGLNHWCGKLLDDSSKSNFLNVALTGFLHSKEFLNKNLNDTEFVKVLYRTFLGRESDAGGLQHWLEVLHTGSSRDEVARRFAESVEFSNIMASYGIR